MSWGYTLLEAPSGATALELIRQHERPIDLLLTDLVMPGGVDGMSLSKQVIADQPRAKVVFMSGYTEHAALNSGGLGPDDYFVQKPFSAQVLSETLHRALTGRAPEGLTPRGRSRDTSSNSSGL
jgi:hypothetical protein